MTNGTKSRTEPAGTSGVRTAADSLATGTVVLAVLVLILTLSWDAVAPARHVWSEGAVAVADFFVESDVTVTVGSDQVRFLPGEVVVRRGERISPRTAALLAAVSEDARERPLLAVVGLALVVLALTTVAVVWLWGSTIKVKGTRERLILLLICLCACTASMKALAVAEAVRGVRTLLNPIPAVAILLSLVLGQEFGMVAAVVLSPLFGMLSGGDPLGGAVTYALVGGLVGALCVSPRRSQRHDIIKAGLAVAAMNTALALAYNLIQRLPGTFDTLGGIYGTCLPGFANGLVGAMLVIGIVPMLEGSFKVTTMMKLQELSSPTQPLLQRLIREAPGTYHHSANVAWLAEMAAKEVGADASLVKAASYYHDIGKLKRPYFFIENQLGGVNYHDQLSPHLSRLIITSHTKDGVELAQAANLPKAVCDIIGQHHGTDLVAYFYHGARQQGDGKSAVDEHSFRYAGPKPQTKEAAVVMLADAVEAACRTVEKPTVQAIERVVTKITNDRFVDGQFDECDLTKKDIESIADKLTALLSGMYHSRVAYPEEDELLSKSRSGDPDRSTPGRDERVDSLSGAQPQPSSAGGSSPGRVDTSPGRVDTSPGEVPQAPAAGGSSPGKVAPARVQDGSQGPLTAATPAGDGDEGEGATS